MFVTDSEYVWYGCCGTKSVVLIECTFNEDLWNRIWSEIKKFLDNRKPVATHWPKHIVSEMRDDLDNYVENCTELIGEVPIVMTDVNSGLVPTTSLPLTGAGVDPAFWMSKI